LRGKRNRLVLTGDHAGNTMKCSWV
jgi:hypothetical protein